jgi:hypothetical protein
MCHNKHLENSLQAAIQSKTNITLQLAFHRKQLSTLMVQAGVTKREKLCLRQQISTLQNQIRSRFKQFRNKRSSKWELRAGCPSLQASTRVSLMRRFPFSQRKGEARGQFALSLCRAETKQLYLPRNMFRLAWRFLERCFTNYPCAT